MLLILENIKNVKLANQLLKVRRKKKRERDECYNNKIYKLKHKLMLQAQQAAAQAEVQKEPSFNAKHYAT